MKLKIVILIVLIGFNALNLTGQVNCKVPYSDDYLNYLKSRSKDIQGNLLNFVLSGEIQSYSDYGFSYPIALNSKNFIFRNNDTVRKIESEDIGGINFLINVKTKNKQLLGIELMTLFQFDNQRDGICWIKAEDIKSVLSENDFHFLEILAFYAPYSNTHYTNAWYIPSLSAIDLDGKMIVKLTSYFYKDLSENLSRSYCYIEYISTEIAPHSDKKYEVEVVNKNVNMNITQIGKYFKENVTIFVSVDPDDPTIGYDSSFVQDIIINRFDQINVDTTSGGINYFIAVYCYDLPDIKCNSFKFKPDIFDEFEPSQRLFWFLEDYFRYSIARNELKKIEK